MKKTMERISLLSLSLMLISSFSITAGLPAMKAYFSQFGYSAGQVELLVSLPAFAVVAMLFLNSLIERWMSERQMIVAGLLLFSTSGLCAFGRAGLSSHLSESFALWLGDRNDQCQGYFNYQ